MSGKKFEPMLPIERGLAFSGRVWDDNDYHEKAFWKEQINKPYWVYSELYIDGDTTLTDHSLDKWMFPERTINLGGTSHVIHEGGYPPQLILTGETKIDSMGFFRLNIQPFYGKGRIALMLNKQSIEDIGLSKGGVNGHNFRWNTIKRPFFLIDKRIEPLNQYSPLPKNYDYYETAALTDPIDRDMFRYGFMAVPKESKQKFIYYDPVSQSYITPDVLKKTRRKWSDFRDVSPVAVMDVKDVMAWLCNIFGDIQDFNFRKRTPYAHGAPMDDPHTNFITSLALQDAIWLDHEMGTTNYRVEVERNIGLRYAYHHIDGMPYFARLNEMLYIFGLDGMNNTYVDAGLTGGQPQYTTATGDSKLLPLNLRFFPLNENFRQLRLYADIDNRRLTHQLGRYHEAVIGYDPNTATSYDMPMTSIFNFTTDSTYYNGVPLPDFMGFRINFQGLTQPVEFYEPNYDWQPEPEETDYRRTVYWNPQVKTDQDGRAHIEFFNNGFSQKLAVSAEGLTPNGQPIMTR
jgi:hypothetical protein